MRSLATTLVSLNSGHLFIPSMTCQGRPPHSWRATTVDQASVNAEKFIPARSEVGEQIGACWFPPQPLARPSFRRGHVERREGCHPAEVALGRDRADRQPSAVADSFGNGAYGDALLNRRIVTRARLAPFQCPDVKLCHVANVRRGPARLALANVWHGPAGGGRHLRRCERLCSLGRARAADRGAVPGGGPDQRQGPGRRARTARSQLLARRVSGP